MISHTRLRILASLFTLWTFCSAEPSYAAPTIAAPGTSRLDRAPTQLAHISIAETGKGSPVVLIPGLSSPRAVWDQTAAALVDHHRVLVVQVNGFGGDAPGANLAPGLLDGIVADLHGYLAHRHHVGVPVIGHSVGGLLTMLLARAHPRDVSKAMIVDSLPYAGEIFLPGATVAMVEPQAKAMRDMMTASFGKPANAAVADRIANAQALKPGSRTIVKTWMMATDPRVSGAALYEALTTDLRPTMASISTPLTIVVPYNAGTPEAAATGLYRRAYAESPHMTIVPVGDSAHFVMLDQPTAFQAVVDAFLGR